MSYTELRGLVVFRPLERPLSGSGSRSASFRSNWSSTVSLLAGELRLHGAENAVMEIDMSDANIRLDGMPRADRAARSPGVVLGFRATAVVGKPQLRYEAAEFDDWRDNVRALALGLRSLRAVDRYGITKRGEQYAGWRALAAGDVGDGDAARGRVLIARAGGSWRKAAALAHPDVGGEPGDFRDVIAARDADRAGKR